MASIQQSANSLFSSLLAASVTGSHAFRQSALGQRMIAARKQKAELANINKTLDAYAPGREINPEAHEGELKAIENLAQRGKEGTLNLATLTGDVERARHGLQLSDEITGKVATVREKQSAAAEKEAEQQSMIDTMTEAERAQGLAAGAAAEELTAQLLRKFGGK